LILGSPGIEVATGSFSIPWLFEKWSRLFFYIITGIFHHTHICINSVCSTGNPCPPIVWTQERFSVSSVRHTVINEPFAVIGEFNNAAALSAVTIRAIAHGTVIAANIPDRTHDTDIIHMILCALGHAC
jgi:hypothetical protein